MKEKFPAESHEKYFLFITLDHPKHVDMVFRLLYNNAFVLWVFLACCMSITNIVAQKDTVWLVVMGGQSNMDGYGDADELPPNLTHSIPGAWIFTGCPAPDGDQGGGLGSWEAMQPGHGVGFASDGRVNRHSRRFGLELSFASEWQRKFPDRKLAVVKYSRGGTSIDSLAAGQFGCWEPDVKGHGGINQYDHFLTTLRNALAVEDIDGDGRKDIVAPAGILWMQGESDAAHTEEIALRYERHLKRLMDLFRAALRQDDVPVVVGRIAESRRNEAGKVWTYGELVQYAQERYVRKDGRAGIVRDTETYAFSDPWHYDSAGYIALGEAFARELFALMK